MLTTGAPGYYTGTKPYTLGPALELRLTRRIAIEAALLYKRLEYGASGASATAGRWELPVLFKYRFTSSGLRPFAALGASCNRLTGIEDTDIAEVRHRGTTGLAAGAGVEARLHRLRIVPEFRVTRWVDRNIGVKDAPLRSNLTQAEFLIGLLF